MSSNAKVAIVALVAAACGPGTPEAITPTHGVAPLVDAGAAVVVPAPAVAAAPCTASFGAPACDGAICWYNPRPHGYAIAAVHGRSADDVWLVGANRLTHWDGNAFAITTLPHGSWLHGVWMASATDGWAVGEKGLLLHWVGQNWKPVQAASGPDRGLLSVWGSSGNDVWVGAQGIQLLHWDGRAWTKFSAPNGNADVTSLWGSEPQRVYAIASRSLLRWDGAAWKEADSPISNPRVMGGFASDDVWTAEQGGDTGHWDGTRWTRISAGLGWASAIWSPKRGDAWMYAQHQLLRWDGAAWKQGTPIAAAIGAVWGTSPDCGWAVGDAGATLRWDGAAWQPGYVTLEDLDAVASVAPDVAWAVGAAGTIVRWDGSRWARVDSGVTTRLRGVWAGARDDAWAVGDASVALHWDGKAWTLVPSKAGDNLVAVWGSGPKDVVVAGSHTVLRWDGKQLNAVPLPGKRVVELKSIAGRGRDDIWITGGGDAALQWNGKQWLWRDLPWKSNQLDVWPRAADDVRLHGTKIYGSGYGPAALRWNGKAFVEDTREQKLGLSVVGGAGERGWAAWNGAPSEAAFYKWKDGWIAERTGDSLAVPGYVTDIAVEASGDAWAVGPKGLIVRLRWQ